MVNRNWPITNFKN